MIVEQRVRREKSATQAASEMDTDSLSDDENIAAGSNVSDDEDIFVDCEPASSASSEAFDRSSGLASTRSGLLLLRQVLAMKMPR